MQGLRSDQQERDSKAERYPLRRSFSPRASKRGHLGTEFLESQLLLNLVPLQEALGLVPAQSQRLGQLVMRDLLPAVQFDQVGLLGVLSDVRPAGTKLVFNFVR